jgi:hypothetical protein
MSWKLSDKRTAEELRRSFEKAGIDVKQPGFLDSPQFLAAEQKSRRILESYGRYIEAQEYGPEYLDRARAQVALVAEVMRAAVEADKSASRCIHASAVIGRMLDELGIWNYQAKATLTIKFPRSNIEPIHFWAMDVSGHQFQAPHAITVAPPFGIVDVTVRFQPYPADVKKDLLPDKVVSEDFKKADYAPEDLADCDTRAILQSQGVPFDSYMKRKLPAWLDVIKWLPPRAIETATSHAKYVIIGVGAMEERLKDLGKWTFAGRTPLQIYEQEVLPKT